MVKKHKVPTYNRDDGTVVKGYSRKSRKKSGLVKKVKTNYGLGVIRDRKTGFIVGTFKYKLKKR